MSRGFGFGWVALILFILLVLIQWPLWFGKGGWMRVHDLQRQIAIQRADNDKLARTNALIAADVASILEGGAAVEERARQELNMIKDGETLFFVQPK